MYAIVKTGGKQYRVAEGDVISIEKLTGAPGDAVAFPAILLVDGDTMTHDAETLASVAVTGEVVAHTKGPKIKIHKYKNKTGYHKRMGHRQKHTEVRILSVGQGAPTPSASTSAAPASAAPTSVPATSVPVAIDVPASSAPTESISNESTSTASTSTASTSTASTSTASTSTASTSTATTEES